MAAPAAMEVVHALLYHQQEEKQALWQQLSESLRTLVGKVDALPKDQPLSAEDFEQAVLQQRQANPEGWKSSELVALREAVADGFVQDRSGLFKFIASLALELPRIFPERIPLLLEQISGTVSLTRLQCAALLAASFFQMLPGEREQNRNGRYDLPYFGLDWMLTDLPHQSTFLISYFYQLKDFSDEELAEVVTFVRYVEKESGLDQESWWSTREGKLMAFRVEESGSIEDDDNHLQADFANAYLGGGALRGGNVQEEIRFALCPECYVGMLFCEKMEPNEAIYVTGIRQFSWYKGYGWSFRFAGMKVRERGSSEPVQPMEPQPDAATPPELPLDELNRRGPVMVALDALMCPGNFQFSREMMVREMVKVYAACAGDHYLADKERRDGRKIPFATGNWGCGAFGGDPQLKAILQWLAASAQGRGIVYYPFGDQRVAELQTVIKAIQQQDLSIGQLWNLLDPKGLGPNKTFAWILSRLSPPETTPPSPMETTP